MVKYIDTDHLKVEIEKHIKEVKDAAERFTPNLGFFDAKLSGIYDVMAIIDSLQQEQNEVDFDKEWESFENWMESYNQSDYPTCYEPKQIACHFYKLGRKQVLQEIYNGKTKPVDKITAAWLDDKEEDK